MTDDVRDVIEGRRLWALVCGDSLRIMLTLPDGCVDAVITDPPYSSGGTFRSDRNGGTVAKYTTSYGRRDLPEFSGDNRDQRSYGYWCALWLGECLRVTKSGGVCCLFTDWRQYPMTSDALQSGGWVWRGSVAWNKTAAARPAKGRFRNQCEYILWGSSGPMADDGECLEGCFTMAVAGEEKLHTAAKPTELMEELVAICPPGGIVLDPFAGSGTTIRAAIRTGRRAIGIELAEGCYAVALARLEKAAVGGPLFKAEQANLFADAPAETKE